MASLESAPPRETFVRLDGREPLRPTDIQENAMVAVAISIRVP
jgi:hypothetical protein